MRLSWSYNGLCCTSSLKFLSQNKPLTHCFYCTVTQLWLMRHCQSTNIAEIRFLTKLSTSFMPEAACLFWREFLESFYTQPFLVKIPVNKRKSSDKDPYCREFLAILHFKMKINCYVGFDLPIPPLCDASSTYPRICRSIHVFCVLFFPQIMFSKERYLFFSIHLL